MPQQRIKSAMKIVLNQSAPETSNSTGWVYCAGSTSYKGLLKIGFTRGNATHRVKQLQGVGLEPFELKWAHPALNPRLAEKAVHARLEQMGFRVYPNKEFFKLSLKAAKEHISTTILGLESISKTQSNQKSSPKRTVLESSPQVIEIEFDLQGESGEAFGNALRHAGGRDNTLQAKLIAASRGNSQAKDRLRAAGIAYAGLKNKKIHFCVQHPILNAQMSSSNSPGWLSEMQAMGLCPGHFPSHITVTSPF